MSKRQINVLVIAAVIIGAIGLGLLIPSLNKKQEEAPDDLTQGQLMDLYIEMLLYHKQFADTIYTDTSSQMEKTGYFGNGGGQKIRTSNNYALYYAFLYKEVEGMDEEFRQEVKEKAIAGIRYGVFTHNSVKKMETIESMATDSGKWWGPDNWQSSLYANGLLFAGSLMWDELDDELKLDIEKVAVAEGDRAVNTKARNYAPGNTGAEENAWDTNGPSLAYCMFPNHENAKAWREASIKFAMNSFSRAADKNDKTKVDGKKASEWIYTANLFDDYSLENHNILHPTYVMSPVISFGDSIVAYAYHGLDIPEAFKYNVQEVADNVLKKLVNSAGEWIYPNGCDWTLNLPGKVEAFAYLGVFLQDPEAKALEVIAAKRAYERQILTGDGRFIHLADIGTEREAVNVKRIMYAYLIHKYVGSLPGENISYDEFKENNRGTKTYLDGSVVISNSPTRFASISWKNKYMGLVSPQVSVNDENPYVSHPNLPNIVGSINILGSGTSKIDISHKTNIVGESPHEGFTSLGILRENSNLIDRYLAMTALPNNAVVVMDMTVSREKEVNISSGYVLPLSFQTDIVSGDRKYIRTKGGLDTFDVKASVNKAYEGDYVIVDSKTAVILNKEMKMTFGDYKLSSQTGGSTLKFIVEPGFYKKDEIIDQTIGVMYSNIGEKETLRLKGEIEYLDLEEGLAGLILEDEGKRYYVINNFFGKKAPLVYEGKEYAPIIFDEASVFKKEISLSIGEGMNSYVGEINKYIYSEGQVRILNSKDRDSFYIENQEDKEIEIRVLFVDGKKEVAGSFKLGKDQALKVSHKDNKIKTDKINSFPSKPSPVANLKASYENDKISLSWDPVKDAKSYIISRQDGSDPLSYLETVTLASYEDASVEEGHIYRYSVVAVEEEGLLSESSTSPFIQTGDYLDATGKVNVAFGKLGKFASGTQEAYPESKALDDNIDTFTVNNNKIPTQEDPDYFILDLLGLYTIDEIVLLLRTANNGYGPKDVEVFYSRDGQNYISLGKMEVENSLDEKVNSIKFNPIEASHIKIKISSSYSTKNIQIAELKVFEKK